MSISEHDVVVLLKDLPKHALRTGDIGTVVQIYADEKAYEVEFVTGTGQTIAVETLQPDDIRLPGNDEILHIRDVTAA